MCSCLQNIWYMSLIHTLSCSGVSHMSWKHAASDNIHNAAFHTPRCHSQSKTLHDYKVDTQELTWGVITPGCWLHILHRLHSVLGSLREPVTMTLRKPFFCPRLVDYIVIVGSRHPSRNNSVAQTRSCCDATHWRTQRLPSSSRRRLLLPARGMHQHWPQEGGATGVDIGLYSPSPIRTRGACATASAWTSTGPLRRRSV